RRVIGPWFGPQGPGARWRDMGNPQRVTLEIAAVTFVALFAGYLVATRGPAAGFAVVLLPLVLIPVVGRPELMFSASIVVALAYPYANAVGVGPLTGSRT